ncbi:hypothetical protein HZS_7043, partial [Henneguya salminicola]
MEMSDEQKTKAGNGAESGPSFSASRPVNPKGITAELDTYMQKEEALRIREERLRTRESEIERAHPSGYKPPNFPPLPHWFPIAPCFYINIEEEIPAQNTALCRQLYIKLMAYSLMQILNVLAMIFILMGLDNSLSPFIASVIICILFVPGSFLFCFRSGYIALKPFDLSPWFCRVRKIFTLHDTCPLDSSNSDKDLLRYYGIEIVKLLETGSYSKAPIYYGTWNKKDIAIKAVKIIDNRPSKHAKYELAVVKIVKHPNIVMHFSYFRASNRIFSVMEYVPDGTLGKFIKDKPFVNFATLKRMFYDILCAINYLHINNIAHRDIKDENIVLKIKHSDYPIPKLCDFGFSVRLNSQYDLCTNYCGTRSFKSPELIHAEGPYNPFRADIWALGILLHKMLIKKTPTYSQEKRKLTMDLTCFPKWAGELIEGMLKTQPAERAELIKMMTCKWFRGMEQNK